tara:strand:- start:38018 stop:38743 length:726 start_codon:yes stop_codon:yes gene_type:complete
MINKIVKGDCLQLLPAIEDGSIDMILCDLPYGTTQCKWDSVIPLDTLWKQYDRILKKDGVVALTAAQPFTSVLVNSNLKHFKYEWIWEKSKATGYLNAKKQPLRSHESVLIFYRKWGTYNPQKTEGKPYNKGKALRTTDVYGEQVSTLVENKTGLRYPRTVQYFKTAESEGKVLHPTQKPIKLFEFLIKTYTNEGDLVLDSCAGSGTTAVACRNLNRNFILFEIEDEYYQLALKRINKEEQ